MKQVLLSVLLLSGVASGAAPAPVPPAPAQAAQPQPAQNQATQAQPAQLPPVKALPLTFTAKLQKIEGGKLVELPVKKSWTLPQSGLSDARANGKLGASLENILNQAEKVVNVRGRPAKFDLVGGRWVATDQPEWKLDREATRAAILEAVQSGANLVEVVYSEKKPQRSVALLAERGVTHNLASARSSFSGSPDFRVKNIVVGASKLDYLWLAPGEVFDFNKLMGDITAANGFVPGYIIAGDTLALEEGGGICQVSTTVFRAMWEAGLPIVERQQHSHRVGYYDPVGYEATVYAPYKNLKMKNDTDKYLFVQASWNTATQKLRFDIFGTDTGRKTKISAPVVTEVKPAAAPTYTPDERVKLGQQRLLDNPEEGLTSVITRTLTLPDGSTRQDSIKSVYKPWGAVYGVHPDDPRLKKDGTQARKN